MHEQDGRAAGPHERVARRPDAVVLVLDATNLNRHLTLAAPIIAIGMPTLVVLNMADDMRKRGFVRKGGWQSGNSAYSMWWNAGTRQCIQGVVSDGRIQSLNPIVEGNCN